MKVDAVALLSELQREPWAMEPRALEALAARLQSSAGSDVPSEILAATSQRAREFRAAKMSIDGKGTATIPISGTLMASVPLIYRHFGIECTGYDEILDDLKKAAGDSDVKRVTLAIESPGGQVSGLSDVADAVAELNKTKPVTADTRGLMASAAYHIGSQAGTIVASPGALVGSIGVYSVLYDATALAAKEGVKVHRIASAQYKGAGVFGAEVTAEHLKDAQRVVDGLAANFKADVGRGRRRDAATVDGWATGQLWIGDEAQRMGLVDRIERHTSAFTSPGVPAAADLSTKGESMTDQEKAAAADKAKQEAIAAEQKRFADLKAAFPKDLAYAADAFAKGLTVEQAKAAHCDIATARAEKAEQEAASLKAAAAEAAKGGTALPHSGQPGQTVEDKRDFMALAKADREEHLKTCRAPHPPGQTALMNCCSLTMAMSRVRAAKPDAHKKFLQAEADKAPEVDELKKRLGLTR